MRLAFLSIGRHIHTERWIRWFAERGHECHLLTVQPGPVAGVEVQLVNYWGPVITGTLFWPAVWILLSGIRMRVQHGR